MIVHENHNFSNGGIVSQINVSVDTTRYYKYVFLLHTMNDKICKRNVKPKFKGMCATWTFLRYLYPQTYDCINNVKISILSING